MKNEHVSRFTPIARRGIEAIARPVLAAVLLASAPAALAQQAQAAQPARSLAQQWGLFVYPAKGQAKEVQDRDEYDCYQWAKQNSGVDPLAPQQAETAQVAEGNGVGGSAAKGAAVGAAAGAAGGAAIGAISGNAGKGAAIGAVAGLLGGGMKGASDRRRENEAAQEANAAASQRAAQQARNTFNKAFGVCLEGRGYTVR